MADEIRYTGYKAEVSERDCADGELTASLNLLNEDGVMRPLWEPKDRYQYPLPSGVKVLYLHRTSEYRHVIVQYTGTGSGHTIAWFDEDNPTYAGTEPNLYISLTTMSQPITGFTDAIGVESIGNTLVVLMEDGMHYFLYQPANGNYKHLGTHLPELELSFGLQGEMKAGGTFKVPIGKVFYKGEDEYVIPLLIADKISISSTIPTVGNSILFSYSNDDERKIVDSMTNHIHPHINTFISEQYNYYGKFVFPFLVRYAIRLKTGESLTMHSSPVLMITNSNGLDVSVSRMLPGTGEFTSIVEYIETQIYGYVFDLDYKCNSSQKNKLLEWSDIVESVDIFISAPIYLYDQSGKILGWKNDTTENYSVARLSYYDPLGGDDEKYSKWVNSAIGIRFLLQSTGDITANIRDISNFYLLKSIPISELATTRTVIGIPNNYLGSLVSREVMTDDYFTHDTLIPKFPYIYNQRLNIANLIKRLALPQSTVAYQTWTDSAYHGSDGTPSTWVNDGTKEYKIWVYTKAGGRDVVVSGEASELGANAPFLYFYYPDPNAYKIVVRKRTPLTLGDAVYYELPLKRHDFLNGAVFFEGFEDALTNDHLATTQADPTVSTAAERTVQIKNKIYTSEIGNPFYFPVEGINTVGLGEIVGMSAATNALSEGQFGQFPLYAFTSDGIYALEVDQKNGLFGQVHPIPRDVCINPDSITQTDDSVLFASKRGIMVLSGRQSACISEAIATETPFNILTSLPGATKLHELMGHGTTDSCLPTLPFQAFLSGCRMVYDYVRQRVTVFNPSYSYAYVFSKKSKLWGMTRSNLQYGLNSYPEALAVAAGNKIVVVGETTETVSHGLMVTRALKFGAPDILKSVHDIVQRGVFRRGHVKTVLWGSRDNHSWFVVGSSVDEAVHGLRGSGYKYFRIGTLTELTEGETVSGASLNVVAKATTKKLI